MDGAKGERRGHFRGKPRPGRRVQVRFQSPAGHEISAHTKNIGVGGAFIVLPDPTVLGVKAGTMLRLMIDMPNTGTSLEIRAEVRWLSAAPDPGMGLRFAGLDVDQLLALNEYFASLTATVDHD